MERSGSDRREFMTRAGSAGAALAALGASKVHAAEKPKESGGLFRVGCLNVYSYSHLIGLWGPLINARKGEKDTPFTNMRITHCWDIEPDRAEEFAKLYGCETVKN
ncbi:twin-arginine translocation signal domain-containing protein, partial [bacterium]|nr:twin-arginine translocation signal domain-containing protein [bacterium]